ncbi:MAG: peptidoglycan bridge formation glycyltransferase FemA/FemB family protein [Candidatus Hydrogenedentes bacterium]|nr:peptidoglycan bridge formation glycyltransferase FemA/FemB family protein [Candidatus Hydrogenedentota bacterium]
MTDTTLTIPGERTSEEALAANYKVSVDGVARSEWLDLIGDFDDATVFQTWDYEAVRWGEERLSHVVLEEGGMAVAAAQVRVVRMPVLNCGVAYVYAGPLWRRRGVPADLEIFRQIVGVLRREYVENRGLALRLVPNEVQTEDGRVGETLVACGFSRLARVKPYRSFLIDLAQPEDRLIGGFRARCRTRVRSTIKKDLEMEAGTSDKLFAEFVQVYRLMRQRKQFEERIDVRDFQEIQSRLPDPLKMQVTVCRLEGVPAAAAVCGAIGNTGNLLLLATSRAALKTSASVATVWRAMVELKNSGVRYFDLGGIDPVDNPGGYKFKSSFGGHEIFHVGAYEACNNLMSRWATHGGERLREVVRKSAGLAGRIIPEPAEPSDEPPGGDEEPK